MAVPARPVSGQPIATPWGTLVHDSIVAVDIQAGATTISGNAAAISKVVTFPRPFSSAPIVVATIASRPAQADGYYARVELITATQFTLWVLAPSGWAVTFTVDWFAMGPRT